MKSGQRGTSIIAALALVSMLGAAAAVADFIGSTNMSQMAAPATALTAPTPAQIAAQQAAQKKAELQKKADAQCEKLKPDATPGSPAPKESNTPLEKQRDNIENGLCVSAFDLGTVKQCFGLKSRVVLNRTVTAGSAVGEVVSTPDKSVPKGQCKNEFVDEKGKSLTSAEVANILKNAPPAQVKAIADIASTLPPQQQSAFNDAFKSASADIQKQQSDLKDTYSTVDGTLAQLAEGCSPMTTGNGCKPIDQKALDIAQKYGYGDCNAVASDCKTLGDALGAAKKDLDKQWADYQKQLDTLAQNVKTITPPPEQMPCVPTAGNPCTPPTPPCPGCNGPYNPDTFNKNNNQFGGNPLGGGGMPRSGGTGGGGNGSNPYGQQQYPGQYTCTGNALYYMQSNGQQQLIQQCPSGCASANSCNTACATPPAQPDPSGCANGTWKPAYGGVNSACVVSWQCVPNGNSSQVSAQISCQPQVADIGMTVAISYSCSAGTATGTGFTTNGGQSGATSVTLPAPPSGTNVVTYGLTCTNQSQTGTAQCTVQIAKPSIILIANPSTVASGDISQLGWVTSSMQSCVISSPDQADFTARNSSNMSINGTATTSPITKSPTNFLLHCVTLGGGTKDATTTVSIK